MIVTCFLNILLFSISKKETKSFCFTFFCAMTSEKSARKSGKSNANYCRAYCQKNALKNVGKRNKERENFPAKYEELKRKGYERKAATKIRQGTDVNESPSPLPFPLLKHHSTKAFSLRKAENAVPNIPRKKVEIVTVLACEFTVCIAVQENKGDLLM